MQCTGYERHKNSFLEKICCFKYLKTRSQVILKQLVKTTIKLRNNLLTIDLLVKLHRHYQHAIYVSDSHHAYQWQHLEVTVYNKNIRSIHVHCHIRMTLMTKYQRNSSNK